MVRRLDNQEPSHGCVAELREAAALLDRTGFRARPSWSQALDGTRPPQNSARDPGEWPHGWQLSGRPASCQAHLRSHSSHNAGMALSHAPTAPEFTIPPHLFQVLVLERLRLPLLLTEATCEACHEPLDALGRHRAACPNTGRLKKRAMPVERMMARVCREAGARVKLNARLRDMNIGVASTDDRNIEVLVQDLPCFGGAQLAIDVTLRSALGRNGEAQPNAAEVDGTVLLQARADKERRYPELMTGRCRLIVVATETGGRWSDETVALLWQLGCVKAREVPSYMTHQAALVWERRWTRMLSTVCALALAASLVEPSQSDVLCETGGDAPSLAEVLMHDPR